MEGFPFTHRERVRFRDLDGLGHVNNAVYLTYMEGARETYFSELGLVETLDELRCILVRVEVDFRAPANYGDMVEVGIRPSRVGTKSFTLEYELRADGRLLAEGSSVLVAYDYERDEAVPLWPEWREAFSAHIADGAAGTS